MIATLSPSPRPSAASCVTPRSARSSSAAPSRCLSPAITVATILPPAALLFAKSGGFRPYFGDLCSHRKRNPLCGTAHDPEEREPVSARDPLRHALDRIRARCGVGADMHAADRPGRERHVEPLLQRQVRMVEVVKGAGINMDRGARGAAARSGDHLLAPGGGRPVVLVGALEWGGGG